MPQTGTAMLKRTIFAWLFVQALMAGHGDPAWSRSEPSALCVDAAHDAARHTGVPLEVLLAVSVVETGRDLRPWPWTVNIAGDGNWLGSKAEAEALVQAALDQGITNIDIGCFQLNLRWHGSAFATLGEMLDPGRNATYAAGYLAEKHALSGDWTQAAAAYHSATPEHAERYAAMFDRTIRDLATGGDPTELPAELSENGFPLLIGGPRGSNGSLVPATSGGLPLLGGP
jgi:hypothetical protein